ncbi:hypothetical protein HY546_01875 [archaeon]|nr:hypothetical protein [archaeon]
MQTFRAKVRLIVEDGKIVQVAKNHMVAELSNTIPGLKVGDIVLCDNTRTIRKLSGDIKPLTWYQWKYGTVK